MHFVKYNASGNDFLITHTFQSRNRSELAKRLCHRQHGIGADGLVVLIPHESHDFAWEFYNSDGSIASMCGNASRATAHYAFNYGLASSSMQFLTGAGVISASVNGHSVESQLTPPQLLQDFFEDEGFQWILIDTGVPHLVTYDTSFDKELARRMRHKYNANVNFASLLPSHLDVRTFERGVEDETLACGTGMCAAFYGLYLHHKIGNFTKVLPLSQEELFVRIDTNTLFFKGDVHSVFETFYKEIL